VTTSNLPPRDIFPCNECAGGMMRLTYITYFTWLDEELITVPHFPAWVCDVCGKREYDERAVNWLATILDPNAGSNPEGSRRSRWAGRRAGTSPWVRD
jgi:YgiT-type zinc finger domain-containing protein